MFLLFRHFEILYFKERSAIYLCLLLFSSFAGNITIISDKLFLNFKPYKHISRLYNTLKRIGFVDLLVIVKVALGVNIPMKLFEMYSNSRYFPGLNKYNIGEHCKAY